MHINWPTTVSFPDYNSAQLQAAMQRRISEATDDDLLASYLHWIEGQITLDFCGTASDLASEIQTELDHLDALLPPAGSPFMGDYYQAHRALRTVLHEADRAVGNAVQQARSVWRQMCEQTRHDLTGRYNGEADPALSGLETSGSLVARSELGVANALARHRDELHGLALREQEMDRFLVSEDSVALDDIHAMTPTEFERTVAALARRDGYHVVRDGGGARDLGADVIAETPDHLRVVFQCKHRQSGFGKVGSPDIQTLNGTARPEHNADIVVAVTNGTFTKPASDFARAHDIHLLCQARLRRWATWGEPLTSVLDLTEARPWIASAS
jgi:restriction system protein